MMYLVFYLTDGTTRDIRGVYDFEAAGQLVGYRETKQFWKEMEQDLVQQGRRPDRMKLLATYKGETRLIDLAAIQYFEVQGRIVTIHMEAEEDSFQSYARLSDLETVLENIGFLRISRFFIVSVRHIVAIQNWEVRLTCGVRLPVGRPYRKKLKIEIAEVSIKN